MKKATLLTFAVMLLSMSTMAQKVSKVYRMATLVYNYAKKDWDRSDINYPTGINVMIKNAKEVIVMNSYEQRVYLMGEPNKTYHKTHSTYTWKAIDKSGTSCSFMIKLFEDGDIIYIFLYDDIGVEYLMAND